MKRVWICLLALLAVLGCGDARVRKAKDAVKDGISKLSKEYEESKVLAHADRFIDAVKARDMDSLKRLCTQRGNADYKTVMGCYYNAFAIENDQGVDAARKYLADEMAKEDNSPAKSKCLKALNGYFQAKGSLRTKEVAALILIFGLEVQYPRRGGKIGGLIAEKLGLIDLSTSQPQPTSGSSSGPAPGP
ncbi:hypothetical protein LCGC14_1707500 [marine sediment metagenome]|uniref:Uncharacterized protein n=1 Tax=marine sediment metagenome TaxID=412755 RepID=A0A0F9HGL9_9ZZZZ